MHMRIDLGLNIKWGGGGVAKEFDPDCSCIVLTDEKWLQFNG